MSFMQIELGNAEPAVTTLTSTSLLSVVLAANFDVDGVVLASSPPQAANASSTGNMHTRVITPPVSS
ncbi:hypothetical protein [Chitinivorax sp. B]|uniref:hypothetical protein n=1 Tax=Chitinivorax sp. B TaxID=2502235 RepID=UPI0014853191|nr:hypothetical protein [Chitinivorax sp. B]